MKKILLIAAILALGSFSNAATKAHESASSSDSSLGVTDSTGGVTDSTGATGDTSSLGSTDNDTGAVNSTDSMGYHDSDVSNGDLSTAQDEDTSVDSDISKPSIAKSEKSRTIKSRTAYPSDVDTERAPSSGADKSDLQDSGSKSQSTLPSDNSSSSKSSQDSSDY